MNNLTCRFRVLLLSLTILAFGRGAEASSITLLPVPGSHYRPGAWIEVQLRGAWPTLPPGLHTPSLAILPAEGEEPFYVCTLPPIDPAETRPESLSFWVQAGEKTPRLRLVLGHGESGRTYLVTEGEPLRPMAPTERLRYWVMRRTGDTGGFSGIPPTHLPTRASGFESVDLLALGDFDGSPLTPAPSPAHLDAVAEWIASGGIVMLFDRTLHPRVQAALDPYQPAPERLFPLPPDVPQPHPRMTRAGRGMVLVFPGGFRAGDMAVVGEAVRRKLEREYLPVPRVDLRLHKTLYDALPRGWPTPPRMAWGILARWLGAWLLLSIPVTLLLRGWWRMPGLAALSVVMAGICVYTMHPEEASRVEARIRRVGEAGRNGIAFEEDRSILVPFASDVADAPAPVSVPFSGWPAPRLQAYDARELADTRVELTLTEAGGVLRIRGRGRGSPLRRGVPILLSRSRVGSVHPARGMLLQPEREGARILLPGPDTRLYEARVFAGRRVTKPTMFPRPQGSILPWDPAPVPGEADGGVANRDRWMRWMAREHRPGAGSAVLMGWETPAERGAGAGSSEAGGYLGVLRMESLDLVPEHGAE